MRKRVFLFIMLSLMLVITGGCNNKNIANENNVENKEIRRIDAFENLIVEFDGWNNKGNIKINVESCDDFVNSNVEFEYDMKLDGTLSNDDVVIIYANIVDGDYELESESCEYIVYGLPDLKEVENFHNGVSWFTYTDNINNTNYIACMDTKGKALFQYENNLSEHTNFVNDRAMIVFDDKRTVGFINKKGEILKTLCLNELVYLCDDYCVDMEHIQDFNNNYYLYRIYDINGNIVFMDKSNDKYDMLYLGNDVMALNPIDSWDSQYTFTSFYFFKNNKRIDNQSVNAESVVDDSFREGVIVTNIDDRNITFLDNLGNYITKEVDTDVDFSSNWKYEGLNDGVVVLKNETDCRIAYYDYATGRFVEGTDKIKEYINKIHFNDKLLYFLNGVISLKMTGEDGKEYVIVLDKEWNVVLGPIESNIRTQYYDKCFKIGTNKNYQYYKYNGELNFTHEKSLFFCEEIAYVEPLEWYGEDGNIVFDDIDLNKISPIELRTIQNKESEQEIKGEYIGCYDTYIEIKDNNIIEYTDNFGTYSSTYEKQNDKLIASFLFEEDNIMLTISQDEMGNLFVDGDETLWMDEYYRKSTNLQ